MRSIENDLCARGNQPFVVFEGGSPNDGRLVMLAFTPVGVALPPFPVYTTSSAPLVMSFEVRTTFSQQLEIDSGLAL